jgi:dimethylamine monooxygenase subunit A
MFDFDTAVSAPFRMQPGLRRLDPGAAQLSALDPGHPAFAEKLAVLREHAAEALLQVEGFDAAPALAAIVDLAGQQCPQALRRDGARLLAPTLGIAIDADATLHAADAVHRDALEVLAALAPARRHAGLLCLALHEDLAVLDGAGATLPWLAVCLPSHWVPRDKIGRSFAEAHAPVADNALIVNAARHLAALVCREPRWERFVWTLGPSSGHDQHPARTPARQWPTPDRFGDAVHFRTERQTFIPLPDRTQAVFTIHVAVQPLGAAVDTPARAQVLHDAIASMSPAVLAYRALAEVRAPLLAWLAQRAQPPAA